MQRLRRYFNRSRRITNKIQLEFLGCDNVGQRNDNEDEINQNNQSNSYENLLNNNRGNGCYTANLTFTIDSNSSSEASKSRNSSQKSTSFLELNNVEVTKGAEQSCETELHESKV